MNSHSISLKNSELIEEKWHIHSHRKTKETGHHVSGLSPFLDSPSVSVLLVFDLIMRKL